MSKEIPVARFRYSTPLRSIIVSARSSFYRKGSSLICRCQKKFPTQISRQRAFLRRRSSNKGNTIPPDHAKIQRSKWNPCNEYAKEGDRVIQVRKREREVLVGVRGRSNFTRGLTLRRVECTPPPRPTSSRSLLSFPPPCCARPCYTNSEIHPVQPLMNVRAACDITPNQPSPFTPHRYDGTRTLACMTTRHLDDQVQDATWRGWRVAILADRIKSPSTWAFHPPSPPHTLL